MNEQQRKKGLGYFGPLKRPDKKVSTELSFTFIRPEFNKAEIEAPLLVPSLSQEEVKLLLSGEKPTDSIYNKAEEYAMMRIHFGLSPFAQEGEQDPSKFFMGINMPKPGIYK